MRVFARGCVCLVVLLPLGVSPRSAAAQPPMTSSHFGLGVTDSRFDSRVGPTREQLDGRMLAIEGRLSYLRLFIDVRGFLGELRSGSRDLAANLALGEAALGVHVIPWVGVKFGVQARRKARGPEEQTWWFWKAGLRGEAALVDPVLYGYLDYAFYLSGHVGPDHEFKNGHSFESGVRLRATSAPITLRFAYRLEHTEIGGEIKKETFQHLVVAIGYEFGNLKRRP